MKRFLAVSVLGVFLAIAGVSLLTSDADAARVQLKWRTSAGNANGFVDSLTASINGAVQTVDTTAAFNTEAADVNWHLSGAPPTAYGCLRIVVTSSANTSSDSLFYAIESSQDGVNWSSNATFIGIAGGNGTVATDEVISGVITCSSTTQTSTGAGTVWMQPFLRVRMRADGNTASIYPDAKIWLYYESKTGD